MFNKKPNDKSNMDDVIGIDKKKKTRKIALIILLVIMIVACDMRLKSVVYIFDSPKIENPVKIAFISDLHGNWYGKNQKTLIKAIDKQNPDLVLFGGDIFDDKISYKESEETISILSKKYKCYYVSGNHEYWSKDIENIFNIIKSYGVTILSGDVETIEINGQIINICGLDDPDDYVYMSDGISIEEQIKTVNEKVNRDYYTILLSHRPEYYDLYSRYGFDLVLSGHAHGGQWRIPLILNGLYAPNQGLFPKYAGGVYDYEGGSMVVSRGLDRQGVKVPRIFNRPEIVFIEIR